MREYIDMTELPCDYQGILANGHFEVYKHFSYCFSTDSKRYMFKGYCKGTSTLRKKTEVLLSIHL